MIDKWILVLGANSDIARATAHRFAKAGYSLFIASRNLTELNKEASNLQIRYGVNIQVKHFDASDFKSHSNFYNNLSPKPEGVILAFGLLGDQKKQQKEFELAKNANVNGIMTDSTILLRKWIDK